MTTLCVLPCNLLSICSAWSALEGFPKIASLCTTIVSAARTIESSFCRFITAVAFSRARRWAYDLGLSPVCLLSSICGSFCKKDNPVSLSNSMRRGDCEASTSLRERYFGNITEIVAQGRFRKVRFHSRPAMVESGSAYRFFHPLSGNGIFVSRE